MSQLSRLLKDWRGELTRTRLLAAIERLSGMTGRGLISLCNSAIGMLLLLIRSNALLAGFTV